MIIADARPRCKQLLSAILKSSPSTTIRNKRLCSSKGKTVDPVIINRILVATDLSPFAEKAVRYAHGLAETCEAELHVLHVLADETERARMLAGVVDLGESDDSGAIFAKMLGEPGSVRRVEAVRVRRDVGAAICEYARDEEIDLIVLSSHGRSGFSHALFGSVAEHVLRAAPCPVVAIRARDPR